MGSGQKWSWEETRMAWALYMQLPFNAIRETTPAIQNFAVAIDRTPFAVKLKLFNISACDQFCVDEGRAGMAHVSKFDEHVWDEFAMRGDAFLEESLALLAARLDGDASASDDCSDASEIPFGAERETTVATRVNQRYFRNRLLENYSERCCLTGLGIERLLVASHIKPWRDCDPATERLAPDNGLLLNSLHDRAFDEGLITLDRELRVVVSPLVPKSDAFAYRAIWAFEGARIASPLSFPPRREFIEYHNDVVFKAAL